jgi:FtsP/CotA-like multicopper oxidase with cupredoxin domain
MRSGSLLGNRYFLAIAVGIAIVASVFAVLSLGVSAQDEKSVIQNLHGAGSYSTTGDVIDPTSQDSRSDTATIDPARYLREFNYGRISTSENGTVIRDFTIIADDSQTVEVSPGVFYNAWTFNGTIPGPTIRATEGDLVRVQ